MTRQQELVPAVCYPSRTCLNQWKAPSEIYPQKVHETGVGRGRTDLKGLPDPIARFSGTQKTRSHLIPPSRQLES